MDVHHVYHLTGDFGSESPLDYRYETLIEIAEHFRMEHNEDLKRELEENLREKLEDLIGELRNKLGKLEYAAATLQFSK